MSNRSKRVQIAQETLEILKAGFYTNKQGQRIDLNPELAEAVENTRLYRPNDFRKVISQRENILAEIEPIETTFEVTNETTLHAARRLSKTHEEVLCLNFASAKNPGGGFLGGSQAQEESLARASGLYLSLIEKQEEMYDLNRKERTCLYSDRMIYSPKLPVFRDDFDRLLEDTYSVAFITSPAVNLGALKNNEPQKVDQAESVMMKRMERMLSVAVVEGHETLILGAWGCGVFRNHPADMSRYFHHFLVDHPQFKNAFKHITFAVLDTSANGKFIQPFQEQFASVLS